MAAEIVQIQRFLGVLHHVKDGVDAVSNLHVGFFLKTVTKDLKACRVFFQLVNEIKNDAMGSSGADDVGEAEDPCFRTKRAYPAADEAFSGLLAGPVKADRHARTVVFRRGHGCVFPVDDGTRCKSDVHHAVGPHGFQDVVGGDGALLEVRIRDPGAEANIGIRSKVIHAVNVHCHGLVDVIGVAQISLNENHLSGF